MTDAVFALALVLALVLPLLSRQWDKEASVEPWPVQPRDATDAPRPLRHPDRLVAAGSLWRVLALLAFVGLAGCAQPAESEKPTTNPHIPVELLFQYDGCKVYRFYDDRPRYFVRCPESTRCEWSENCGKGCTRPVEVEVVR